ncbi:MAG: hypothetical protein QM617_03735, partial [Comamonas sp.]
AIKVFEQLGMDFGSVAKGARQDQVAAPAQAQTQAQAAAPAASAGMVLRGPADEELLQVESLRRVGNELVIKGKSFGTMPMEARLDADSARAGLKLLGLKQLAFLASLPLRKSRPSNTREGSQS